MIKSQRNLVSILQQRTTVNIRFLQIESYGIFNNAFKKHLLRTLSVASGNVGREVALVATPCIYILLGHYIINLMTNKYINYRLSSIFTSMCVFETWPCLWNRNTSTKHTLNI